MSFDSAYTARFKTVIEPAIESVQFGDSNLKAKRVDLSKTGDSILTDINDGVAHSLMVLADVSTVGHDSKNGWPYRNGNVMYEVGLALASRHSSEVLLIRDDTDKFLFDVSTVPHMHIDFADAGKAKALLAGELMARLNEIKNIYDARLAVAAATLTAGERTLLSTLAQYKMNQMFSFEELGVSNALPRLLDKQIIRTARMTTDGKTYSKWTRLGYVLAQKLDQYIPVLPNEVKASESAAKSSPGGDEAT